MGKLTDIKPNCAYNIRLGREIIEKGLKSISYSMVST